MDSNKASNITATVSMLNLTKGEVRLYGAESWSGGPILESYPPIFTRNRFAEFTHAGNRVQDGTKAAVVYFGTTKEDNSNHNVGWVLAWHVPGDGSPNKVYVEFGDIDKYNNGATNWGEIRNKLDASSNESYQAGGTPNFTARISAKISKGDEAAVFAAFEGLN